MKTTETVTLPLFFLFLFIWCGGAFFNNVLHRNAMSVFLCSFHQFSMFCLCSNFSPCNFCLLVVQLFMRFCFFRKNFQYAVAMCVGYFSTTFCAEMQCRCFFAVFISFQCFLRSNLSPCNFCLLVVQLLMRFCFFRKNFQYAVAMCVGYFSTTFCAEMQCRCFFAVLISFQCFVCAVIFHRVIFVCSLCSCSCDFVFHGSFCVFVCKLSGRLSGKVPRQGSLLVSTVCLA